MDSPPSNSTPTAEEESQAGSWWRRWLLEASGAASYPASQPAKQLATATLVSRRPSRGNNKSSPSIRSFCYRLDCHLAQQIAQKSWPSASHLWPASKANLAETSPLTTSRFATQLAGPSMPLYLSWSSFLRPDYLAPSLG